MVADDPSPSLHVVLDHAFGDTFAAQARTALPAGCRLTIAPAPTTRDAMLDADVVWHVLSPVTADMIAAAPRLTLIQKIGVGVNTIDLAAAKALGIAVCNMPGTNTQAVVETTLMLMLAALRQMPALDRSMRAGSWDHEPALDFGQAREIAGRTVGLIGFGAVAQRLAPVLRAMGARVIAWNRSPRQAEGVRFLALDDVIATADILSLHVPLAPDTQGLLSAASIARMKPGAVLVNTARGGLVDEPALVAALASGRIAAGLDVFADEPVSAGHPLMALPNVALTPHVAWRTAETLQRSLAVAVNNLRRLRAGESLAHRVV
jgi:phosphoglycerate dehydrogenase-like enzyme